MARKTKAACQTNHFLRRVNERFGMHLNENHIREMVGLIRGGQSKFIDRQSHRVAVHDIQYKGETMRVCYDSQRDTLVTALLPEWEPQTVGRLL